MTCAEVPRFIRTVAKTPLDRVIAVTTTDPGSGAAVRLMQTIIEAIRSEGYGHVVGQFYAEGVPQDLLQGYDPPNNSLDGARGGS